MKQNCDIVVGSDFAASLNHPLADCVYLAMAKRLDVALVTADDTFVKRARAAFERVYSIREALTLSA